ncbi:MAG: sigma-70 family RNA polymerase sigma factor [Planctomycetota bacterium]
MAPSGTEDSDGSEEERPEPGTIDILQRMADGDVQAINALYERYEARILAAVTSKAGAHLRARVEPVDLKQEVVRRSLARIRDFRPEDLAKLRWWFQRLAEEVVADEARRWAAGKRGAHGEVSMNDDRGLLDPTGSDPTPSKIVGKDEFMQKVGLCLAEMPEHYREILDMRVNRQLPFRRIAEQLGISEENAQMRESRAIAKLRECMRRRGETF